MSITAGITHLTRYRYDQLVTLSPQIIRLRPAPHSRTRVISHALKVSPGGHFVNHQQDPYGNWLARFVFPEPVRELSIEVDLVADMTVYNPFDFFVEESAEYWPFDYPEELRGDLAIYRTPEPAGPELQRLLDSIPRDRARSVDFLVGLNAELEQRIDYIVRMEPGVQTPEDTLALARGSCRDSSWLLVQILRHLGFAARFVSGYLIQLKPDLKPLDGPAGTDTDFTDLHAWCEVFLPGAGWIGLDPTSGLLTGESHIPLAATPHYAGAAPIVGGYSGPPGVRTEFEFNMQVTRLSEHPRITKPFSEASWDALDAFGTALDDRIATADMRLTMGGEPTFVSFDDFESDEWNTDAVGPTKRGLADQLIRRLRDRFAPGGFLHYGQGKWYPGETLPRWTFSLYWRRDGGALWSDPARIAEEGDQTGAGAPEAAALLGAMAESPSRCRHRTHVQPAFEDPAEWLVKEANLPDNVTPENSELKDAEARARIARVFDRGLDRALRAISCRCSAGRAAAPRDGNRSCGRPGAASSFWCPATAPWAFACRLRPCPISTRPAIPTSTPPIPISRASPCPTRARSAANGAQATRWPRTSGRRAIDPTATRCARPSRSRRATGGCASSCRRWSGWRITWTCWPRPRTAPTEPGAEGPYRRLSAAE